MPNRKARGQTRVHVLYTGGTFGSKPDSHSVDEALAPMELAELNPLLPATAGIVPGVEVTVEQSRRLLDSSSMTPGDWRDIALGLEARYDRYDGFVILHGTDTLAYTASALSFMLENLAKPVVITGSQRPLIEAGSDAPRNYANALKIAAGESAGLPRIPEVVVAFGSRLLRGCRTRKLSASALDAFDSPNTKPLGRLGDEIQVFASRLRPPPAIHAALLRHSKLETGVIDITLFPGQHADYLSAVLGLEGVKGVVLRSFGGGNAPEDAAFLKALKAGIAAGDKIAVNVSQCLEGRVDMDRYAAGAGLRDCGVVSGLDMTPEAALCKLMIVLAQADGDEARAAMQSDWRGELTPAG